MVRGVHHSGSRHGLVREQQNVDDGHLTAGRGCADHGRNHHGRVDAGQRVGQLDRVHHCIDDCIDDRVDNGLVDSNDHRDYGGGGDHHRCTGKGDVR